MKKIWFIGESIVLIALDQSLKFSAGQAGSGEKAFCFRGAGGYSSSGGRAVPEGTFLPEKWPGASFGRRVEQYF